MNTKIHRVGIIAAMQVEIEHLYDYFPISESINFDQKIFSICNLKELQIISVVSKVGQVNAAITATQLIEKFNPNYLIFLGVAGAVDPLLNIGNIIIGEKVLSAEYLHAYNAKVSWSFAKLPAHQYLADPLLLEAAKRIAATDGGTIKAGIIGSSDFFPVPDYMPSEYENIKISAIDMESVGFYQACHEYNKPAIVIRGISNNAFQVPAVKITKEDMLNTAKKTAKFVEKLVTTCPPSSR